MYETTYPLNSDIKTELDKLLCPFFKEAPYAITVVKSVIVNGVYYGAFAQTHKATGQLKKVYAKVAEYKINRDNTFSYKSKFETQSPYPCECPNEILDLLSPTTDPLTKSWRKICYSQSARAEQESPLYKLPLGSRVSMNFLYGKSITLVKCEGKGFYKGHTVWADENPDTNLVFRFYDVERNGYKIIG